MANVLDDIEFLLPSQLLEKEYQKTITNNNINSQKGFSKDVFGVPYNFPVDLSSPLESVSTKTDENHQRNNLLSIIFSSGLLLFFGCLVVYGSIGMFYFLLAFGRPFYGSYFFPRVGGGSCSISFGGSGSLSSLDALKTMRVHGLLVLSLVILHSSLNQLKL